MKDGRPAAIDFRCPECGAWPGVLCIGRSNRKRQTVHDERRRARNDALPSWELRARG